MKEFSVFTVSMHHILSEKKLMSIYCQHEGHIHFSPPPPVLINFYIMLFFLLLFDIKLANSSTDSAGVLLSGIPCVRVSLRVCVVCVGPPACQTVSLPVWSVSLSVYLV